MALAEIFVRHCCRRGNNNDAHSCVRTIAIKPSPLDCALPEVTVGLAGG